MCLVERKTPLNINQAWRNNALITEKRGIDTLGSLGSLLHAKLSLALIVKGDRYRSDQNTEFGQICFFRPSGDEIW